MHEEEGIGRGDDMRRAGLLLLLAGCGASRFQVGAARPMGDGADAELAQQVRVLAEQDRTSFLVCFDRLAERAGTTERQAVGVTVGAGLRGTQLLQLVPAGGGSMVDEELRRCVGEAVAGWHLERARGRVRVDVSVVPRPAQPPGTISAAASRRSDFHPSE